VGKKNREGEERRKRGRGGWGERERERMRESKERAREQERAETFSIIGSHSAARSGSENVTLLPPPPTSEALDALAAPPLLLPVARAGYEGETGGAD